MCTFDRLMHGEERDVGKWDKKIPVVPAMPVAMDSTESVQRTSHAQSLAAPVPIGQACIAAKCRLAQINLTGSGGRSAWASEAFCASWT